MDKPTKLKVLSRLRSKRNEIDEKIHKKTLEITRILHKKSRGNWTFDQSNKMHNQIMRGYGYIKKWTSQVQSIEQKMNYIIHG